MMNYIETVGNIRVYEERHNQRDTTITFMNGSDIVASEIYFTGNISAAIADLFAKKLDIYTAEWIRNNINIIDLTTLSENTYRAFEQDYFCRIDNTRYFKHFNKSADEFITDKNGMRIIDR